MSPPKDNHRRRIRRREAPVRAFKPRNGQHTSRLRWLLGLSAVFLLAMVAAGSVAAGAGFYGMARYNEIAEGVVPPEELISKMSRGGARIYDREGRLLYEFVDEVSGLRRPVPLSEISEWMTRATISTEDASYYENTGINLRGMARAAIENLTPFSSTFLEGSGGSSITQQLAKNVYIPREERAERSIDRKVKEAVIALELTEKYSKDQILEWYLNSISYGGIYMGVEAAAQGYFGKPASDLTLAEAALLAGIPASPALYAPLQGVGLGEEALALSPSSPTRLRQLEVLDLMVQHEVISPEEAEAAKREKIAFRPNRFDIEAPHFVLKRVADEVTARFGERALFEDGLVITTTLDLDLQHMAEEILERHIVEFGESTGLYNGALVALDPVTGQILTYVGSRDYFSEDIEGRNDNVTALNSPGSTLKPFTFMTAFMQGWGTGTAILDTPYSLIDAATGGAYTPRDPIATLLGPITTASALGNSLNITAVKAIQFAGVDRVVNVLKQVGFTSLDNPGGYGPALTVGGVDITLLDEVIGFSVLANNGVMRGQEVVVDRVDPGERTLEPISLLRVEDYRGQVLYEHTEPVARRVVQTEFPYLVTSILSDGSNQCITYGVCNALALPDGRPSAAKTGTSEPFENSREIGETWTVGYTPNLVAGVWSGNADNSPIVGIDSTRVSLRSWKEFMVEAAAHLELPPERFTRPPGVVERELCWPSGRLPSDLCPRVNRYSGLFAESVLPRAGEEMPEAYDTWWQKVRIDTRTGLLAAPTTPATLVEEAVRLVFPEKEVAGWSGLEEWAAKHSVASLLAPRGTAEGPLPVQIVAPVMSQTVNGLVNIRGTANAPDFARFTVEWGRGLSPSTWVTIRESNVPVFTGTLAAWDTKQVPDGEYTIRVRLEDTKGQTFRWQIPVVVKNGKDAPPGDFGPQVWVSSPLDGSVVKGVVSIQGIAGSGDLEEIVTEVGAGLAPTEWTEIARTKQVVVNDSIARWNTEGFEDGAYIIRITVRDKKLGSGQVTLTVNVRNKEESR
jgi:membrane peptidoglycan carboxypeptidase